MKRSIFFTTAAICLAQISFNSVLVAVPAGENSNTEGTRSYAVAASRSTDSEIVNAIRRKLSRDRRISKQLNNIRIYSRNGRVKIAGWITGKGVTAAIRSYAMGTKGVRSVSVMACPPCQKLCAEGYCINRCDECSKKARSCPAGQTLDGGGCIQASPVLTCPVCPRP